MRKIFVRGVCRSMLQRCTLFSIAALLLTAGVRPAWTQSNAVDGAVSGYVTDPSGASIPSAVMTLTNQETNVSTRSASGPDGHFRYPLVPLGTYTLSVTSPGYKEYIRRGITVAVGADVVVSPKLVIGGSDAAVDVTADASMIDASTPVIGGVISQQEMDDLPLVSRNIYNLFLFVPGAKGIPSDNFATPAYSFGGILRATWTTDGIDNTDRSSTSPIRLVINTPTSVKQIQVLANGYQAEFGKSSGGQTTVITRGGDNSLHGSAMYMYRPQPLAAIPVYANPPAKVDLSWYMADGSLSGPIVRDRLFYFVSYEHNPYTQPTPNRITAATIAALGLTAADTAEVPTGQNYDSPSIRVDYKLSERSSGFLRYTRFTNDSPYSGAGGTTTNSRSTRNFDNQNGGEIQLATTFSPTVLNELRFGINRRETIGEAQNTPSATDVDVNITGYANIGNSPSQSNVIERLSQIVDNITWDHGKHLIKAGGDYQLTNYYTQVSAARTFTFSGVTEGTTSYTALQVYLDALNGVPDPITGQPFTYTTLSLGLGNPGTSRKMQFFNGFVQDQYRFSRRVTGSGGLRYEKQLYPTPPGDATFLPASRQIFSRNLSLAPRFAVSVQASNKTMLSAAGGLFFDVPNLLFFTTVVADDGNSYHTYTISGDAPGAPIFPNVPTSANSQFLPKPTQQTIDPDFRSMYAVHGNVRLQQELSPNFLLSIDYMFVGTRFGPYSVDTNLTPTGRFLLDGRPIYSTTQRPNANFGAINQYTSGATTSYNGIDVSLDKRATRSLTFSLNYSYSHALGDSDQNGYVVSDPSNLHRDYGNMSADVRHYFAGRGIYTTHFAPRAIRWASGIQASMLALITSGRPLDPRVGGDPNGDLFSNDRPNFASRNSFHGPNYYRLDARGSKVFTIKDKYQLEAIVEGSNILNHVNAACAITGCNSAVEGVEFSTVGTTTPSATFGEILTAASNRTVQLGVRFSF